MKYRVFAAIVLGVLVLNLGGSSFADTKAKNTRTSQLVAMLPASDGVVIFDAKRVFGDALPQVLANNQPVLGRITGKIDEFQKGFGIDVRQFDEMVVGVSTRQVAVKNYDVDPVVIARGPASSESLIAAAKQSTTNKFREERVGGRVMYIFHEKVITSTPTAVSGSLKEAAVAAIDERTIAFGDIGRVRQTLENKTRVGADLIGMLQRSPGAIATFAAKPPAGLKAYLPLDNDELGKNIDSIQYIYGNANVAAGTASVHVTARTLQNVQATSLYETLQGLQMLGKAFLGGAKAPDKQVYARLIENAKFSVKANEVSLDLSVAQSDIDIVVGSLK